MSPFDGFCTLLPLESRTFDVALVPQSAVTYSQSLNLWTSVNDKYSLPCRGEGIEPPLQLSTSVLQLRNTSPGQRVRADVFVRNVTRYVSECLISDMVSCDTWRYIDRSKHLNYVVPLPVTHGLRLPPRR